MRRRWAVTCLIGWGAVAVTVITLVALYAFNKTAHTLSDWVVFEVGARILVHFDYNNLYNGPRLHLYSDNPKIQIGPPALWFVAAFQSFSLRTVFWVFTVIITVITTGAVAMALLTGRQVAERSWGVARGYVVFPVAAIATVAILVDWGARWKHLDDVMALTLAAAAALLISKQRHWWLIGLLLGTGVATKPWAIILTPMLLALPRRDIARATLATVVVAGAWWAPFVIGDPNTLQALGHLEIVPKPGSVLHLIGIHDPVERWLRPVQFFLGLGVGVFVCRRRFWLAAPLAALATRVLTDPFAYGYYGTGPVLFAFLYDCSGRSWRGLPVLTAFTAGVEFVFPVCCDQQTVLAVSKAVWAVVILVVLLAPRRADPAASAAVDVRDVGDALPASPAPA